MTGAGAVRYHRLETWSVCVQGSSPAVLKDLVLVGGGLSHVAALRRLSERGVAGLRVTLVSRDAHAVHPGMLADHIAGRCGYEACHVDLGRLARVAGARLLFADVSGLDLDSRRVLCRDRPPLRFDLLSLDPGPGPAGADVPGVAAHAVPLWPSDRFLAEWDRVLREAVSGPAGLRLAVVGDGVAAVELTLGMHHRLQTAMRAAGRAPSGLEVVLVASSARPGAELGAGAWRRLRRLLHERGIRLCRDRTVVEVEAGRLLCAAGEHLVCDAVVWARPPSPPAWLVGCGLASDAAGRVRVDEALQSVSHAGVFAAGDTAARASDGPPRPEVLVAEGERLAVSLGHLGADRPRRPPLRLPALRIVGGGGPHAVASWGRWSLEGAWISRWKAERDRRFMAALRAPPRSGPPASPPEPWTRAPDPTGPGARCGGSGAKVGATVLARVMNRLATVARQDVLIGLQEPDDAAVVAVAPGHVLVQSVDFFRAFLDDPYVFGQVAANHALSDLFAMGAQPHSALALATIPFGPEWAVEETLYELMAGALEVLNGCGAALIGGHTGEGTELSFGLTVNGVADRRRLMRRRGMLEGDLLVVSKPLGTGTLFAADLRGQANGVWVRSAIASMVLSNQAAAACVQRHGARACTDLSGFGLLGHLVEMTRASGVAAVLDLDALPLLEGAAQTLQAGIFSSLAPQNARLRRALRNLDELSAHPLYPVLFDPQTAGGLLASVPEERAEGCVRELRALGYRRAAVVGRVEHQPRSLAPVRVVTRGAHHPPARLS